MSWAIRIVEHPVAAVDFMTATGRLPVEVGRAVLDHVVLLSESVDPANEFAEARTLLVYLLHPGAAISLLTVDFEDRGVYSFAIPFQCTLTGELDVLGLWILSAPSSEPQ